MTKTERFISRATQIHGNKYSYANTVFVRSSEKISIDCNTCNRTFQQLAHNHLAGSGCKDCQYKILPQNQARTKDDFVELARKVHGDKYNYPSMYINKRTKI
jgi:protein-arginine kinase activator protein McsA